MSASTDDRVLVAQSSHTLQLLIRMTLSAERLNVTCVTDGRAALAEAQRATPLLVIADADLPGMDGYALAEHLGAEPDTAEVPVLLLVADWDHPDTDRVAHAKIADVLPRPFEQHDLRERVRALLGRGAGPEVHAEGDAGQDGESEEAQLPSGPDALRAGALSTDLEALVARELQALVLPRVEALIEGAVQGAVAALFADPSKGLDDTVAAALQTATKSVAHEAMETHAAELLGPALTPLLEPIAWKVVPELAEDMLREEIRRLTEEEDP